MYEALGVEVDFLGMAWGELNWMCYKSEHGSYIFECFVDIRILVGDRVLLILQRESWHAAGVRCQTHL